MATLTPYNGCGARQTGLVQINEYCSSRKNI